MRSLNFNIPLLNNRIVFFDRFKDLGGFLLGMFESLGRTDIIMLYGTSDCDNNTLYIRFEQLSYCRQFQISKS